MLAWNKFWKNNFSSPNIWQEQKIDLSKNKSAQIQLNNFWNNLFRKNEDC
jgi:hypothetical protein